MKSHIFNTDDIKATLQGRKTQFRTVLKVQPFDVVNSKADGWPWGTDGQNPYRLKCPFGKVGDKIWIKETFNNEKQFYPFCTLYKADDDLSEYIENGQYIEKFPNGIKNTYDFRWQPSPRMTQRLSRLTLEITSIRVERLGKISEEDAKREGITEVGNCSPPDYSKTAKQYYNGKAVGFNTAKAAFLHLFDSIHRNVSQNPYVWVIEFKKVDE